MKAMHIHALASRRPGERRTAVTPESARRLAESGHRVTLEPDAGLGSGYDDPSYAEAGAEITTGVESDLAVCVEPPEPDHLPASRAILGLLEPFDPSDRLEKLASGGATCFCFELAPRSSRAQSIDALSSQATLAGYQAVLEGAALCDRILPMMTTAAGTLRPGKVLVLGAGVAGLQAIATARRLGASVSGFDVRAAAAEQVESLGASFIAIDMETQDASTAGGYAQQLEEHAETRLLAGLFDHVAAADVVITTAAIPGRKAPLLVTGEMVAAMRPGSVVIDGSASTGGNCELTRPGETIVAEGVTVAGPLDLVSRCANHASQLYARNVANFVALLTGDDGELVIDTDDDIIAGTMAARDGKIVHEWILRTQGGKS